MANTTNFYFIGRVGNTVGSTWKGIPYSRYEPDHQKQSQGSVDSGKLLGFCSSMGAAFRSALQKPWLRLRQERQRTVLQVH